MIEHLIKLRKEVLAFLMTLLTGAMLLLAWHYVIRNPVAEYMELSEARGRLEQLIANGETISEKILQYRQEIAALGKQLRGENPLLSSDEITAHVIGQLDRISMNNKVKLSRVTPGEINKVLMFDEVPFDIEVMGKYTDLYRWLDEVTVQLGPMVIPQFKIHYNPGAAMLNMNVKLASYKVLDKDL